MSRIIIGIHGMGNKPPPKILSAWWKAAIGEGLKRIGKPKRFFNFDLFYWAHYLHPVLLTPGIKDNKHPLYINEPYSPAEQNKVEKKPSELRQRILDYVNEQLQKIFLNEDLTINYASVTDFIIHHFFSDLEIYFNDFCVRQNKNNCKARVVICSDLANILKKHRRKKIMLIAHSMGSIIAFDVLTQYAPEVPIDTFVTIGSPLGLPVIKSKIVAEHKKNSSQSTALKTPGNILTNWYNLSDLKDKIAINYKLSDDYQENAGHVRPADTIVTNNYEYMGENNPHKSYGYLRTPELSEIIIGFLEDYRHDPFIWLKKFGRRIMDGGSLFI